MYLSAPGTAFGTVLVDVVSADVIRYRNNSTRCSPIRAPA